MNIPADTDKMSVFWLPAGGSQFSAACIRKSHMMGVIKMMNLMFQETFKEGLITGINRADADITVGDMKALFTALATEPSFKKDWNHFCLNLNTKEITPYTLSRLLKGIGLSEDMLTIVTPASSPHRTSTSSTSGANDTSTRTNLAVANQDLVLVRSGFTQEDYDGMNNAGIQWMNRGATHGRTKMVPFSEMSYNLCIQGMLDHICTEQSKIPFNLHHQNSRYRALHIFRGVLMECMNEWQEWSTGLSNAAVETALGKSRLKTGGFSAFVTAVKTWAIKNTELLQRSIFSVSKQFDESPVRVVHRLFMFRRAHANAKFKTLAQAKTLLQTYAETTAPKRRPSAEFLGRQQDNNNKNRKLKDEKLCWTCGKAGHVKAECKARPLPSPAIKKK